MLIEDANTIEHIIIAIPLIAIPLGAGYIIYRINRARKEKKEREDKGIK